MVEGERMTGQMTIYDILYPGRINPIREVAKHASVYWTDSREKIATLVNTDPDIKELAAAVKHEYSPYGFAGHYGGDHSPNSMLGWTLKANHIETEYFDTDGSKKTRIYSWEDFAREIADLCWSHEYERSQA